MRCRTRTCGCDLDEVVVVVVVVVGRVVGSVFATHCLLLDAFLSSRHCPSSAMAMAARSSCASTLGGGTSKPAASRKQKVSTLRRRKSVVSPLRKGCIFFLVVAAVPCPQ
ncbi:hypothetical protein B0T24DRAFT_641997 [Lasiosphaeria ovina]|uniref:Uncharacterized protein n=1 Tax=Lasiosphaeria ovina TaxID=92902 RepID=A0AAE0MZQ6_9PEZI|nr:hypothetical protein B0T24DRAFT_641997 [Lasiosphaeria ovina]